MFSFLLQLRHMLQDNAEYYLFAAFSALVWLIWAMKVVCPVSTARTRPRTSPRRA